MTLPSYSAISFRSEEEHKAALYDACLLIVNTYNQSDMLEDYAYRGQTSYEFMTFARFYRDWETDRKSTRLNSSHLKLSRMPSSA